MNKRHDEPFEPDRNYRELAERQMNSPDPEGIFWFLWLAFCLFGVLPHFFA